MGPDCGLVGQVESSVTFRATVRVRIKARFAGNGPSLGKKRNTESHSHSGSRRAAPQASWAVLQPLERACHPRGLRLAHNACGAAERYRTFHLAH